MPFLFTPIPAGGLPGIVLHYGPRTAPGGPTRPQAGPTRPQDRVALSAMKSTFTAALSEQFEVEDDGGKVELARLREAFPSGCEVEVAGRSNLAEMLRQVGISPSESPATGVQVSSARRSTKGPES